MIKMITFVKAVQLPGNGGATTTYNVNIHKTIRVERCAVGFELHFGRLDAEKKWQASGLVKTVTWQNVVDFDEERTAKEQKKQ